MKRGTVSIATPQDRKLVDLSAKLNTTTWPTASRSSAGRSWPTRPNRTPTPRGFHAAASRAVSKATGLYRNAEWDLVDRLKDDPKFDVTKLSEAQLCDEMKKMKPAERVAHVKDAAMGQDGHACMAIAETSRNSFAVAPLAA